MSLVTQLLILVSVLSLGPLVVTNLVGYLRSRDDLQNLAIQTLQSSAHVAALQTRAFVEEKRDLVPSLVAGNEHLRQSSITAAEALSPDSPYSAEALHKHLAAKVAETPAAAEFYVLTPDGRMLGSSDPAAQPGIARHDASCPGSGEPVTSTIVSSGARTMLVVGSPIRLESGERLGTFCGRFRFDVHAGLRQLAASQSPEKRFLIATTRGRVLCDSFDDRCRPGQLPDALLGYAASGQSWSGSYEPVDGSHAWATLPATTSEPPGRHLAAIAPIAPFDWAVITELPESHAMASLDELRERVGWMSLGFVALVILGIGFTVRMTALPLKELVYATQEMKDGRLAQRVDARGPREVAELAEVFNAMSHRVARLHDTLEERVRRRTRELENRTEELRRNQAFSELLFNAMDEHLLVIGSDFVITKANRSALATYGEDLIGRTCYDIFESGPSPCDNCPVSDTFGCGRPSLSERVYNREGRPQIMEVEVFPLPSDERRLGQVLMVSREITEQKSQQAQLAHHEKMAAFALLSAGIAHEIGNPLASIKAQVRLASELEDSEFTSQTLQVVDGEVDRISRLLRQISHFARRRHTPEALVSWNPAVEDALQLLRHDPRSHQITFETDLARDLPAVRANPDDLLQILLNLGINAIDAIDGRGTLRIETGVREGEVCLRVSDDGPGVPKSARERIFEPYFTTKPTEKGTGLGLFVSRRLVEEAGGTITYEPGHEGASFLVCLPRATTERAGSPDAAPRAHAELNA